MSIGETKQVRTAVGLHQESAFSYFLCLIILDTIIKRYKKRLSMGMWFANDLILCNKEAEKVDARRKRMKKTLGCEAKAKQNQDRGCDASWHYQKC